MKLYDVVALTRDMPDQGLRAGQVGTLIEQLDAETFEVEFADLDGQTYAELPVQVKDLLRLSHEREVQAG